MSNITLKSQNIHQHTLINNLFIDHYMPKANGDYVKVYIYMLRLILSGRSDFTIQQVAKQMNLIQSDVHRAIRYWAELKLIEVTYDDEEVITSIGFLSLEAPQQVLTPKVEAKKSKPTANPQKDQDEPRHQERKKQARLQQRPQYSMDEMTLYTEQSEFKELLYITERYLKKPLSQADVNVLLGFVDWLGLSMEVVEFLIEYCASDGHRHMNYIEKVAIDWADQQFETVEQAKAYTETYNKNYYRIFKALGLSGRQPTPNQMKYMDRWTTDYNFSIEVIELACEKTISAINKPELAYVDTILTRWHNKGVKSMEAVAELDRNYKTDKSNKTKQVSKNTKNKFHNHQQREYDFDDIEKKMDDLLDKRLNGME